MTTLNSMTKRLPKWSLLLIAFAPIALYVLVQGLGFRPGMLWHTLISAGLAIWGLTFAGEWSRRLDEVSHAAQIHGAVWGWPLGTVAGLILATVIGSTAYSAGWLDDLLSQLADRSPGGVEEKTGLAFMLGAALCGVTGMVGSLIAWALWWAKRR